MTRVSRARPTFSSYRWSATEGAAGEPVALAHPWPDPADAPLVIGVGNRWRGDDGAGPSVAGLLRRRQADAAAQFQIREVDGGGLGLIEAWSGAAAVFLIDAVCSGAEPGTIHCFEPSACPLPAALFRHSTHAFGVVESVELARVLRLLPPRLIVYGIEGRQFALGEAMSPEVDLAARALAVRLWGELARAGALTP